MLIKEYRIPLPLSVDEYKIAQLYMIAKKSREESKGAGSGVEILINEPYQSGPGGHGQYTRKIYHVGSHLPGWIKSLLPKSALTVEEEAWNAYPYTKTRYGCPFLDKLSIEIETMYFEDNGYQDNVFGLSGSDLRNRAVDFIDVVKDQVYGSDYLKEEDPKMFVSEKTGRGPLSENWLQEYWAECQGKSMPTSTGKAIMCAYKLTRVEFRYWGMQTKLEKFIHDVGLRKTMVRAHRQAWAWQDEWMGLTMDDIREIERQTQEALKVTMGLDSHSEGSTEDGRNGLSGGSNGLTTPEENEHKAVVQTLGSIEKDDVQSPPPARKVQQRPVLADVPIIKTSGESSTVDLNIPRHMEDVSASPQLEGRRRRWSRSNSRATLHSPTGSGKGFDLQIAGWRMESIRRDSESDSESEYFDCLEDFGDQAAAKSLVKWSSLDLLTEEDLDATSPVVMDDEKQDSIFSQSFLQRVASERGRGHLPKLSMDLSCPGSPTTHPSCTTTVLILVLHAGSVLDANVDLTAKKSDVTTFRGAFESVMRQHYPSMVGHVSVRLVSCSSVCTEGLGILSSLSPYSFDVSPSCTDTPHVTHDSIPIGAIPVFASSSSEYHDAVSRAVAAANSTYHEFLKSDQGRGFNGQVVFVGDSMGSILAYDALCRNTQYSSRHDSENSILDHDIDVTEHLTAPAPRRRSSSTSEQSHCCKLEFDVSDLFMFGSPLSLVLAYRKISTEDKSSPIPRPSVGQVYNLFHPTDPVAARLEPLISARFSMLPPVNVARYQKYPLGDGQPYHLLEMVQANPQLFTEGLSVVPGTPSLYLRRMSEISIQSNMSGMMDTLPIHTINSLSQRWWGAKRLDYALYCPEGLANFPTNALPHLFHASYWESSDVIAFILRQLGRFDLPALGLEEREMASFSPSQPREKWIKKRTSVKLKNVTANHRANDIIVKDGTPQTLVARFMYGPLDMITLTGEKVDIHVMKDAPAGEWSHLATEVTDKTGRVTHTVAEGKTLGYGMYPVKMVVRGDHTCCDMYMTVVPPMTESVVFSIDGSFTASVSVTGRDPKVRAGAVDIVRHWQELGYLIIYITGRPDIQQQKVVSWLSQHNFPHGLVSFADGLSTDPLGHKADYLKNLMNEHGVIIHAAYGSSKDISVYTSLGLRPKQIFIVGKVSKKHHSQATVLAEGYAAHLTTLMAHGGSRPAQGNARMVIPRGCFGLPGQNASLRRRRSAKRATSYPLSTNPVATSSSPETPQPQSVAASFVRSFSRRKSPRPPHSAPAADRL